MIAVPDLGLLPFGATALRDLTDRGFTFAGSCPAAWALKGPARPDRAPLTPERRALAVEGLVAALNAEFVAAGGRL